MKETIRERLEKKGHSDPDKALENFGVKVEQKGHPRFSNEGFMWYGNMITDPTKDETGAYTVDPRVYYATHYEQWLVWKERRSGNVQNVTQEGWGDDWTPEQRTAAKKVDDMMLALDREIDQFLRKNEQWRITDPQHLERLQGDFYDSYILHKPYG